MSKISKMLILSLVVVALASSAFATTSRVAALGGANNYINDDSDIFRWYGTLPSYANMVMAEAGQATGGPDISASAQALGFTHSFGDDHWLGTWGIFLLYNSIEDGSFFAFNPLASIGSESASVATWSTSGLMAPSSKFVLHWGNEIEDLLAYGLSFTRSDASFETVGGGEQDINQTTVGGGVRMDVGDDSYADVAITLGFAGGDTLGGFDKSTSWDLGARLFHELRDDLTAVPYVAWRASDFSYENTPATSGLKTSDFQAGLSMNFDVNTNNMLIFATEVEFISLEPSKRASGDQQEVTITHLPMFTVALESDITSWLTTRVGATKTMRKTTTKDAAGDETITTAPGTGGAGPDDFSWSLGAGFHIGEWDVDAVLSEDLPFRMGYWLTGFGSGDDTAPVGRLSATYRF